MQPKNLIGNVADASAGGGSALGGNTSVTQKISLLQLIMNAGANPVTFTIQQSTDAGATWTNVLAPMTLPASALVQVDLKAQVQKPAEGTTKLLRLFASSAVASAASASLIGYEEELS